MTVQANKSLEGCDTFACCRQALVTLQVTVSHVQHVGWLQLTIHTLSMRHIEYASVGQTPMPAVYCHGIVYMYETV